MKTIGRVLSTPSYAILATVGGLVALWLILWSVNFSAFILVIGSHKVATGEKINFAFGIFQNFLINFNAAWVLGLLILSIAFGVGLATLIFLLRHSVRTPYDITD